MILAILDDLMFTSKIRSAAAGVGVPIAIARSSEAALAEMRKSAPALVIFDLNSTRLRPLDAIAALKRDSDLTSIRTLGYVSHVDTATIDAARAASIDQVMARSAFANQLGEILTIA